VRAGRRSCNIPRVQANTVSQGPGGTRRYTQNRGGKTTLLAESGFSPKMLETIMIFGIPIVGVICTFAYMTIRSVAEIALKRDMVARGMTPEEMRNVLRMGRKV
jgi:hypothetical protein